MFDIIIGIILLVAAVFLIASVLLQSSKSHKLSGTIAGGAETFFGKTKGTTIDRILGKVTSVVAIIFCVLVVVMYVAQDQNAILDTGSDTTTEEHDHDHELAPDLGDTTEPADDTTEPVADDTTEAVEDTAEVADDTTEAVEDTAEPADEK